MDEHNEPENDQDQPDVRHRLRAFGAAPLPPGLADSALERVRAGGRRKIGGARLKLISAAAVAGFAAAGVGLAAADVLPGPVQDAAHSSLASVGVHVPPGHVRYNDPIVCPGGPYANHGAYVRSHKGDPNAGKSPCGKPAQAAGASGTTKDDDNGPGGDTGNKGHGPPPWAHGAGKSDKLKDAGEKAKSSTTTRPTMSTSSTESTTSTSTSSTTSTTMHS